MAFNDDQSKALVDAGFSDCLTDALFQWYNDNAGTGSNPTSVQDALHAWLTAEGFTGSVSDMWQAYAEAQGFNSPAEFWADAAENGLPEGFAVDYNFALSLTDPISGNSVTSTRNGAINAPQSLSSPFSVITYSANVVALDVDVGFYNQRTELNNLGASQNYSGVLWQYDGSSLISSTELAPDGTNTAALIDTSTLGSFVEQQITAASTNASFRTYVKLAPSSAATHTRIFTLTNAGFGFGLSLKHELTSEWFPLELTGPGLTNTNNARCSIGGRLASGVTDPDCQGRVTIWSGGLDPSALDGLGTPIYTPDFSGASRVPDNNTVPAHFGDVGNPWPANNFELIQPVISQGNPAGESFDICEYEVDVNNSFNIRTLAGGQVELEKVVAGVSVAVVVTMAMGLNRDDEIVFTPRQHDVDGMRLTVENITTGETQVANDTTAQGKADIVVPDTFKFGGDSTFNAIPRKLQMVLL